MSRIQALLLAAASLAAVALWVTRSGPVGPPDAVGREPAAEGRAVTADPELAALDTAGLEGSGARTLGPFGPTRWTVVVRREDRGAAGAARVEARKGAALLEGEGGEVRWDGFEHGEWLLSVTLDGRVIRRPVTVTRGEENRTVVVFGRPARLVGSVLDVAGEGLREHFIGLVPAGTPMPTTPRDWLKLPSGRSGPGGGFDFEVDEPGDYRVFVGHGGKILVESDGVRTLEPGRAHRLSAVIPPPVTLILEVVEPDGALRAVPYMASVYRLASILDAIRPVPELPPPTPPDLDSMEADERAEAEMALKADSVRVDPAELARRRSVVPEGFRVDRSAAFGADGRLVLTGLPVGEELRFALRRGREVFPVEGSAGVNPDAPTLVRLLLPADSAAPVVQAVPTLTEGPERRLDPGIRWE